MRNLKGRVSLLLALSMMMMTILPIVTVNAATDVGVRRIMTASASYKGKALASTDEITISNSETNRAISVKITDLSSTADVSKLVIYYAWDNGSATVLESGKTSATFNIPSNLGASSSHTLQFEGVINDNTNGYVGQSTVVTLTVNVPAETASTVVSTEVKNGYTALVVNNKVELAVGTALTLKATTNTATGVKEVYYRWDNGELNKIAGNRATIVVPNTFKVGDSHLLRVQAIANDGTQSTEGLYGVVIKEVEQHEEPIEEVEDEFVVEPWMKENKDLDVLAVSLRNDSENADKANKNMYALDERVVYYVDYKNGSSKTKKDVKVTLELPLDVKVIKANGGTISGRTITWNIGDLEEGEAGTRIVVLKYTNIGKSNIKSKIVYPIAKVYEGSKVVDSSSVINLIYKDVDTEIVDDEHYPYMYGDADANTFRPDDGITRAEGALVLTRIFGMNTSAVVVRDEYSDLDETYVEAQKAIVAATKAGLINGYGDGTYRPNEKMTRAEFMKIIAAEVELMAEQDDIDGLEVEGLEDAVKLYKNPVKVYVLNDRTYESHWALPYVTLLARLNMTDVTEKNKDLRMDEYITRAEVAQLINFYLFRAPAEVSSRTKSGFSDVTKNHKLFADIIEATRAAHTYTITVDGTEIAIYD